MSLFALAFASTTPVTVNYQTLDKTAKAGRDYGATTGTLTFVPGQTLAQIPIAIDADTEAGPNLIFQVKLSKPVGATLGLAKAVVTLVDLAGPMSVYVNNPVVQPLSGTARH